MTFPSTRWSQLVTVASLQGQESASVEALAQADQALQELCRTYWYPLYAHARSLGNSHEDAEDLTQAFFEYLLENRLVARADRSMAKFRTFLLTHFTYVISMAWRARQAKKRGGRIEHLSLDFHDADERFQALAADSHDPSLIYDRAWAGQVVETTLILLEQEYARNNLDVPFSEFRGYLPGGGAHAKPTYQELERRYPPLKAPTLMTRVSRLNTRFRELLVSVIADTVADPAEVDAELRHLARVLTST